MLWFGFGKGFSSFCGGNHKRVIPGAADIELGWADREGSGLGTQCHEIRGCDKGAASWETGLRVPPPRGAEGREEIRVRSPKPRESLPGDSAAGGLACRRLHEPLGRVLASVASCRGSRGGSTGTTGPRQGSGMGWRGQAGSQHRFTPHRGRDGRARVSLQSTVSQSVPGDLFS